MNPILEIKKLNILDAKRKHLVRDLSVSIEPNTVVSIIGPPFSGKTAFLQSINRLNELYHHIKTEGEILYRGVNIKEMNSSELRKKTGMVFKNPDLFPFMNLYENVISGYTLNDIRLSKEEKDALVERCLKDVDLWEHFKNDLTKKPDFTTKGEKQRLCIARTIALNPDIILMDEPTCAISVNCTNKIEDMIYKYKKKSTIIVATSNISQAARISDFTMYINKGELIEYGETAKLFWNPSDERTERYINSLS
ncbi:MAG: ATP-binding cassette domain-containing protein [Dysgonamonadaceae bacterium]|jgi:phosphate transport system ATP-binding protein|nr:ATP-binding cassette domain-containing protein [Dysgonamonadaceae bacterium]